MNRDVTIERKHSPERQWNRNQRRDDRWDRRDDRWDGRHDRRWDRYPDRRYWNNSYPNYVYYDRRPSQIVFISTDYYTNPNSQDWFNYDRYIQWKVSKYPEYRAEYLELRPYIDRMDPNNDFERFIAWLLREHPIAMIDAIFDDPKELYMKIQVWLRKRSVLNVAGFHQSQQPTTLPWSKMSIQINCAIISVTRNGIENTKQWCLPRDEHLQVSVKDGCIDIEQNGDAPILRSLCWDYGVTVTISTPDQVCITLSLESKGLEGIKTFCIAAGDVLYLNAVNDHCFAISLSVQGQEPVSKLIC